MRLGLTTVFGAALLVACTTGYKPESMTGGYSEQKRAPDVWQVWFLGNGSTSQEKCDDFAMLRGAELCLAEGKPFMRASKYESYAEPNPLTGGVSEYRSAVEVTCLAEASDNTEDAAAFASKVRKYYGIAAPKSAR